MQGIHYVSASAYFLTQSIRQWSSHICFLGFGQLFCFVLFQQLKTMQIYYLTFLLSQKSGLAWLVSLFQVYKTEIKVWANLAPWKPLGRICFQAYLGCWQDPFPCDFFFTGCQLGVNLCSQRLSTFLLMLSMPSLFSNRLNSSHASKLSDFPF